MAKPKHQKIRVPRFIGMSAWNRPGAGAHTDKKKESSRKGCRKWHLDEN